MKSQLAPAHELSSTKHVVPIARLSLAARTFLLACAILPFAGCSGGPSYAALFDTSPEAEGTGIVGVGLVRAVVIIAKYQATERQRHVADQRARTAYAKLARQTAPGHTTSGTSTKSKRKMPRYIAVDTEPDARSKTGKSVMIWNTETQEVVGNNVYDVQSTPRPLETARFETYSAQYVGRRLVSERCASAHMEGSAPSLLVCRRGGTSINRTHSIFTSLNGPIPSRASTAAL
jgi:hypothetical protein